MATDHIASYKILWADEIAQRMTMADQPQRMVCEKFGEPWQMPLPESGFGEQDDPGSNQYDVFDHSQYRIFDQHLWRLENCRIITRYGLVALEDYVLRESTAHFPWILDEFKIVGDDFSNDYISMPRHADAARIDLGFCAVSGTEENYFHWIVLTLGRLCSSFLASRFLADAAKPPVIIFPPLSTPVHRQSAEIVSQAFKLPYLSLAENQTVAVDTLLYPKHMIAGGTSPHPAISEVYLILKRALYQRGEFPRHIYISRRDSQSRKMLNEPDLEAYLFNRGYTIITLSDKSLQDQINIFAHAEKIITPHGAGLTNIGFCEPGTRVLEIHPPRPSMWVYRRLAAIFNIRYGFLLGARPDDRDGQPYSDRYIVDIAKVRSVLEGENF